MHLTEHFRMLARDNRSANERLYDVCAELDDVPYRKPDRQAAFMRS